MILFFKILFSISFEEPSLQRYIFKILVKTVNLFGCTKLFCVLQLLTSYCVSIIMVNITRYIFINYFPNGTLFSCEIFHVGYEKNMSFRIPNCQKLEKELKRYCISRNFRGKIFFANLTQTFPEFLFSRLCKRSCKLA